MKILPLRQIVQILPLLLANIQTGDAKLTKQNSTNQLIIASSKQNFQKIYNKLIKSV